MPSTHGGLAYNPDFCRLVAGSEEWDIPDADPTKQLSQDAGPRFSPEGRYGCGDKERRCMLGKSDFYVCPKDDRNRAQSRKCGGYESLYCAKWGCETTGDAYWRPSSTWDKITVTKGWHKSNHSQMCASSGSCLPLNITFTPRGKQASDWSSGYSWGLRWYIPRKHRGIAFTIRFKSKPMVQAAIGPNQVLSEQKFPSLPVTKRPTSPPVISTTRTTSHAPTPPPPGTGDRLLGLIQGAYSALNLTDPNRTQECWLCLISRPQYYEGVAVNGSYSSHTSAPASCGSTPQHKLTLSKVSGQGSCIGNVPHSYQGLCDSTQQISGSNYLMSPNGTYWACNTGLTPCVSTSVLDTTADYCVLVALWPKVVYHEPDYIYSHFEGMARYRREPVFLTLALLLGGITMGGIAAGIGTGTTALIETSQFRQLQQAMHTDIQALEESVSVLEKSLTSLSEVVLQNRRGLDILFLQEGGLCIALKEECCFYADHTGLVRDNMAKLRERLKQRQQLFESQQGWFEGWFNKSPWFTTLISSLMGPLIILLLILLFGPCVLNWLVQFMKDRLSVIQALVLTQQYHQLRQFDPESRE